MTETAASRLSPGSVSDVSSFPRLDLFRISCFGFRISAAALLVSLLACNTLRAADRGDAIADEPPALLVGLDAYRQWDLWPLQRIGQRTYMRSTYDRRGGN